MKENDRAAIPLLLLLCNRLGRMTGRLTSLATRAAAGKPPLRPTRPKRHRQRGSLRLPRGMGWLIRLVPEAASFGGQLAHLVSEPEFQALLEAAPQAARVLRPLCRMLAVPDTLLAPPRKQPAPPPDQATPLPLSAAVPGPAPPPTIRVPASVPRRTRRPGGAWMPARASPAPA